MKISVNKEKCIGCGTCVTLCDQIFDLGSDGKAKVKTQKDIPCVNESVKACPTSAISVK